MLALKQALSLASSKSLGGDWNPNLDSNLVAWYKKAEGIVLNGSDVSEWRDESGNGYNMAQADAAQQPAYSAGY